MTPAIILANPMLLSTLSGNRAACNMASRQLRGLRKGNMPSMTSTSASAGIKCSHIDRYFLPDVVLPDGSLK